MTVSRHSKKRDAIYAALASTKSHPAAEWIYQQLKGEIPDLSLGTVYRNLSAFKKEGLAVSVATVDGRERFDAATEPHVHFICRTCGTVDDLAGVPVPGIPRLDRTVETVQLNYYGVCRNCAGGRRRRRKEK